MDFNFKNENEKYNFDDLVRVVELLRAPGGCPWDREQTHESIKRNLIEEGYELIEAIDGGKPAKIADESGDLMLQVVFHAVIGKEADEYDIDDVTDAICRKLIHRHPHVFGDVSVSGSGEVLKNWDARADACRENSEKGRKSGIFARDRRNRRGRSRRCAVRACAPRPQSRRRPRARASGIHE